MTRPNYSTMDSGRLIEELQLVCTERGILMATEAPDEELQQAQRRIDKIVEELIRHLAW